LFPVNSSVVDATAYRWPKNDGEFCIENVSSLMVKSSASLDTLGICRGWYPLTHL